MANKKEIKKEIFKLFSEAISIVELKEDEIFILENELGSIKFFNSHNKQYSIWFYCDKWEWTKQDNLLLLKCKLYGDRLFNLNNFEISNRVS